MRAEGRDRVEAVVHAAVDDDWRMRPGTEERVEVDALCIGYGFFPSVELFRVAGCELGYDEDLGGPVVAVDAWQRTTVPGVLAAGDGTGVRGSYVAEDQGRLAVLGLAADEAAAAPVRRRLEQRLRFQRALNRMYRVGPGIYELTTPDTVICRCEEIRREELDRAIDATPDINVVKAFTRATMGLCQGRNCQRQIAALASARHGVPIADLPLSTPRSPARPTALAAIADDSIEDHGLFVVD